MDAERALLAKAITAGTLEQVISYGVGPQHFAQSDCRELFKWMVDHLMEYRAIPSLQAVRDNFPTFAVDVITDPTEYVFKQFTKGLKRREAIEAGRRMMQAVDNPTMIDNIEEVFLEEARALSQILPSPKVARYSQMFERIEEFRAAVERGDVPMGITFGIPTFDELTFGIQQHEFVAIAGWQGLGKSTLCQHILFNAYLEGRTAMIISLEMESSALLRKWDVMTTQVEYKAMKAFKLGHKDLQKWEEAAERARNAKNDIIILDDLGRKCTIDKVYAEIVRYKPDIVAVDYLTLLHTPGNQAIWEKVTDLTREFKSMCRGLTVPIIGVVQTNIGSADGGATLDTIAYSRSIGQDADIVLGLHQDKDGAMRAQKKMEVRLLKNRDGEITNVDMYWDPSRMEFREWSARDMFQTRPDTDQTVVPLETAREVRSA